jgi:hypothetical protein
MPVSVIEMRTYLPGRMSKALENGASRTIFGAPVKTAPSNSKFGQVMASWHRHRHRIPLFSIPIPMPIAIPICI